MAKRTLTTRQITSLKNISKKINKNIRLTKSDLKSQNTIFNKLKKNKLNIISLNKNDSFKTLNKNILTLYYAGKKKQAKELLIKTKYKKDLKNVDIDYRDDIVNSFLNLSKKSLKDAIRDLKVKTNSEYHDKVLKDTYNYATSHYNTMNNESILDILSDSKDSELKRLVNNTKDKIESMSDRYSTYANKYDFLKDIEAEYKKIFDFLASSDKPEYHELLAETLDGFEESKKGIAIISEQFGWRKRKRKRY